MSIYAYARIQMKQNGNPNQWGDSRPTVETIRTDIDRHKDNAIMQHILESHHFTICGTIYADDGSPRIAYQKVVN
jgi:ABC-type sugar transport system substrate-binding protein